MINNPIIYKFFKDLTNYRKKTYGAVVLPVDLSPTFLNTEVSSKTFKKSGKQDYFFRRTTGIQSGSDTFNKSKCYTFLTILEVTEILRSFRLF